MTFLVTDACVMCKHTDCVDVCPVDCFYEGENFLVINPDECIDCAVCVPECPVDAIIPDDQDEDGKWLKINTQYAEIWPNITEQKPAMPEAEKFGSVTGKFESHFSPAPGAGDD